MFWIIINYPLEGWSILTEIKLHFEIKDHFHSQRKLLMHQHTIRRFNINSFDFIGKGITLCLIKSITSLARVSGYLLWKAATTSISSSDFIKPRDPSNKLWFCYFGQPLCPLLQNGSIIVSSLNQILNHLGYLWIPLINYKLIYKNFILQN